MSINTEAIVRLSLIATMTAFFSSTIVLYFNTEANRDLLTQSVRVSNWSAYQAQIEFAKLSGLLASCGSGGRCDADDVLLRAEIVASRLDVLANSEEASIVPYIHTHHANLSDVYDRLSDFFVQYNQGQSDDSDTGARKLAIILSTESANLGELLQHILSDATQYNNSMDSREEALRLTSPTIPFLLLVLSGTAFIIILLYQLKARERALKRIEELRRGEQRQQQDTTALVDSLPVPVCVVDGHGQIVFLNVAGMQAFGSAATAPTSRLAAFVSAVPMGDEQRTISLPDGDGLSRSFRYWRTTVMWSGYPASVYVLQDTMLQSNDHLQAMGVSKLLLLGELSSAIVHEMSQPLMTIRLAASNAKLLLPDLTNNVRVHGKLGVIQEQIDRIGRIVTSVRQLSLPIEATEPFVLKSVIDSSMQIVAYQFRSSAVVIELEYGDNINMVLNGNAFLLEIAIINILLNARDAYLSSAETAVEDRTVRITVRTDEKSVILAISDQAGGIQASLLNRLFDSFVSSKHKHGGMGVGLSIGRRAVESMRGTLKAENRGRGACLTITLPVLET